LCDYKLKLSALNKRFGRFEILTWIPKFLSICSLGHVYEFIILEHDHQGIIQSMRLWNLQYGSVFRTMLIM